MQLGIIGSGSWATALAKILTNNGKNIYWWIRNEDTIRQIRDRGNNPSYLSSVSFNTNLLTLSSDIVSVIEQSEVVIIATPSAYVEEILQGLKPEHWEGKKIVSAVKGILPGHNILLNYYLEKEFGFALENYFAILGPCHAEEVAAEKLSYLTFSGIDSTATTSIADYFTCSYINTIVNPDILGVQYAAVLKNIYAVGAGIVHGLEYGDNFLSVYIANAADEMALFLKRFGAQHIVVGEHETEDPLAHRHSPNYAASVYLGDLLVTCYSPHSRNRRFGSMIGKGYAVKEAILEMNMVAEGYNAAKCIHYINASLEAPIPLAEAVYAILWENVKPGDALKRIEEILV